MTELDLQLARIRTKLDTLQAQGWEEYRDEFGIRTHKFILYPSLSESEVTAFEREHEIRLPPAYRAFVREIGNGGAGPYYGITPLLIPPSVDVPYWLQRDVPFPAGYLSAPCLIDLTMHHKDDWEADLDYPEDTPPQDPWCLDIRYQGVLPICNQGCSYYVGLILNGEARGRIVNLDGLGQPPVFAPHRDFLHWYERWLDALTIGDEIFWFGMD